MRLVILLGCSLPLLAPLGCGRRSPAPQAPVPGASADSAPLSRSTKAVSSALGAVGAVRGRVRVSGPVRPPGPIREMETTPQCARCYAQLPLRDDLVVDREGYVQWAFVYVKKGLEGKSFAPPREPVVLDQEGCLYKPHVFGIMVGQPLVVQNSDDFLHNVHGLPFANKGFNFGQPIKGLRNEVVFTQPEVMVFIKCEIHGWMKTWAGVLEHPFYAVTDAAGKFEIRGVPPGKYTVEAWHEKYQSVRQEVELKADETKEADFLLSEKKG